MRKSQGLIVIIGLFSITLLITSLTWASSESATKIMEHAYKVNGGDDLLSRITFTFHTLGSKPRKLVMSMATKNYHGKDGLISKSITFNEYPPTSKDISFLSWIYRADLNKEDDMWLYLPELRTIRKLAHDHDHNHMKGKMDNKNNDDLFTNSELTRHELLPRYFELDTHELIKTENIDGIQYYVIESIPKHHHSVAFSKTLRWITTDNYLPTRIEYYDSNNTLYKEQTFEWQKVKDAWVWEKVEATNKKTGNKTVLEQADIKVNTGLDENAFSKRMMKLGGAAFLSRQTH